MTKILLAAAVTLLLCGTSLATEAFTAKSTSTAGKCQTACDGRTLSDYNIQKE